MITTGGLGRAQCRVRRASQPSARAATLPRVNAFSSLSQAALSSIQVLCAIDYSKTLNAHSLRAAAVPRMARLTACCERKEASRNSDSRASLTPPISPSASTRFLNLRSCMQQDCKLSYLTGSCSWHIIGADGLTNMAENCSRICLHPSSHVLKKCAEILAGQALTHLKLAVPVGVAVHAGGGEWAGASAIVKEPAQHWLALRTSFRG